MKSKLKLKLRPYQTEAVEAILRDWINGFLSTLLVMATGGGKTLVFLALLDRVLGTKKRALIVAHRRDLITQPVERLAEFFPERQAGIVMADQDETDQQITFATIQTLSADGRLEAILANGQIDYLIIDEAHHAPASAYLQLVETLRIYNPELRHLGVTATPIRADGDGLSKVYQHTAAKYGIVELIKAGYLAPVRWLAIQVGVSLAGVRSRDGDFVKSQLRDVFETDNVYDLVVESHKKYAMGRQAIAFTVTVDGAYALAEKFNEAGISASAADAKTKRGDRAGILRDFRTDKIEVLCNVGLYTEGLDVPQASCIHQVRPTKSDGLYVQMIGRSLRIYPGKTDALILDYAPLKSRNIAMMGDVLGTPLRRESYVEDKDERGEVEGGFTFDGNYHWLDGSPAEIVSRQLDYLELSIWSWYRQDGWMSLGLGKASDEIERTLVMSPPGDDDKMKLWLVAKKPKRRGWKPYLVKSGDFDALMEWCNEYANERGNAVLAMKNRGWRKQAATEAQIRFAQRIGAKYEGMKKGQLGQSLTHRLATRAIGEW